MTENVVEKSLTPSQEKAFVMDAIVGMGVIADMPVMTLEKAGYIYWTGDQYNVEWKWDKVKLEEHSTEDLMALYMEMKYAG